MRGSGVKLAVLAVGALLATLLAGAALAQVPPDPEGIIQNIQGGPAVRSELIVGYEEGVTDGQRESVRAGVGATLERSWSAIDAELLSVEGDAAAAIRAVEGVPGVRYAEPNHVFEPAPA